MPLAIPLGQPACSDSDTTAQTLYRPDQAARLPTRCLGGRSRRAPPLCAKGAPSRLAATRHPARCRQYADPSRGCLRSPRQPDEARTLAVEGQQKDRGNRADGHPKPGLLERFFPAGFIGVDDLLLLLHARKRVVDWCRSMPDTPADVNHPYGLLRRWQPPELLSINGCIVTIDAMGCQKPIAAQIIDQEADYVLAVKRNQPHLYADIQATFAWLLAQETPAHLQSSTTHGYQHGRDEIRTYWTTDQLDGIRDRDAWKGLQSIGITCSDRDVQGKVQQEMRYYIISRTNDVHTFGDAVRTHWSIENNLHWVLDVAFREDDSRIHKDHAPQNMAAMRHMALNLLQQDQTHTGSIRTKRLCAGWNDAYLEVLLTTTENDMNQA